MMTPGQWTRRWSSVWHYGFPLSLLQGVGGLYESKKGALRDECSCLYQEARGSTTLQGILLRPPLLSTKRLVTSLEKPLLLKVKFHRLRSSVPGKLWRWKEVTGWQWRHSGEHIDVLELRAILTTLRWLVVRRGAHRRRFLRLTDILVCLRSLSRGRTSSRKLRHVLKRVNSLILAADLRPVWGYIHTSQNPADRPSRRPLQRKWGNQSETTLRRS